MAMIIDFIKSWAYYHKMEKYFNERGYSQFNVWNGKKFARFRYAWWHCRLGKLVDYAGNAESLKKYGIDTSWPELEEHTEKKWRNFYGRCEKNPVGYY